ncbi:hypothetical protein AURDEDRAFT_186147 [Auricularia subglabra TFB-10046 SS5]|nr:hypothetical protein AURDEDRAFT_186147 [Auricularia subglabra TFB-10046 SS5]
MFALDRLALAIGQRLYNDRAIELARTIHPRFVYDRHSVRPRMVWKMSVDLSRPLVPSEGNLDPIDGFVVFTLLQRANGDGSPVLSDEIADYSKIVRTRWEDYESDDPLDLGMMAWTVHWLAGRRGRPG